MSKHGANFVMIVGLIITLGGVGGIETSTNDTELMGSMLFAILGMLTMYCSLLAMRVLYD